MVGDHFGTFPPISQTFMVDSPSANLQTHKVSGRNSSRGRVGGPDRSRARATWGPLEPCTCDLRTTEAVRVQPADHKSCAHATCGPLEPCARDLQTIRATCGPLEPCARDMRTECKSGSQKSENPKVPCLSNVSERGPGTSASENQGQARPQEHKAIKSQ